MCWRTYCDTFPDWQQDLSVHYKHFQRPTCICAMLKGSETDRIDVLRCVRREWVCECVCVWIKQLIPRPAERNILSARFSFPVSLWQGEKGKKDALRGDGGFVAPETEDTAALFEDIYGILPISPPPAFIFLPFFFYYLRFNKAKASSLFCHETFISRL